VSLDTWCYSVTALVGRQTASNLSIYRSILHRQKPSHGFGKLLHACLERPPLCLYRAHSEAARRCSTKVCSSHRADFCIALHLLTRRAYCRSWHTAHAAPGDTRQPDSGEQPRRTLRAELPARRSALEPRSSGPGLLREEELLQRDLERYQQRASVTPQTFQTLEEARPQTACLNWC